MKTRTLMITLVLAATILSGCSARAISNQNSPTTESTSSALSDVQLAAGTLNLHDTANSVTTDQASELLTLWLAYSEVTNRDTSSDQEVVALVNQIEACMTTEQVSAIQAMNLTTADIESLTGNTSTQSAAQVTGTSSQSAPANLPADGGMMGGDIPGAGMAAGNAPAEMVSASSIQPATSNATLSLVEPLIKMLQALSA